MGLNTLILSNNFLTGLPESLGALTNLQSLHLDNNELSGLPESLGKLPKLDWLSAHGNTQLAVPDSIKKLATLQGKTILKPPVYLEMNGERMKINPDKIIF